MVEYIDLKARYKFSGDVFNALLKADIDMKTAIIICNDIPNADVVEIRHGEWEQIVDLKTSQNRYQHTCGACGSIFDDNKFNYPYCPNCGAKMDGKGEGE